LISGIQTVLGYQISYKYETIHLQNKQELKTGKSEHLFTNYSTGKELKIWKFV
jgi:hypothetical protein